MKYKLTAKSPITGNVISSKIMLTKPTWSDTNKYANRVSIKYGMHPQVIITEIKA